MDTMVRYINVTTYLSHGDAADRTEMPSVANPNPDRARRGWSCRREALTGDRGAAAHQGCGSTDDGSAGAWAFTSCTDCAAAAAKECIFGLMAVRTTHNATSKDPVRTSRN